ncbi:MAG: threonylcarbamoyl-AMP synthase [Betaproteobacteria bacterium]|nr:threonylcarbamoyl-AMP synthase [Betaproteobacteria bacterium]MDE2124496.1 threonylcarbamoyl-AMP synthase [Betaproteobacteria bacterium]MDE2187278.1 threonylcarbamoyl-AMP synthase [Betaproteobacteria bacterium]MDE2325678.1 threonylcarbamoyl-AMP synthase [Betaproteobacteria bacterium]
MQPQGRGPRRVTPATVHPREIIQAAGLLEAGELVGLPTETVYGLAADAANPQAVAKIYAAKGRPANHPVIVHLHRDADPMRWAAELPDLACKLIAAFWPGPLTLVLPRRAGAAEACAGGQDTIALRCPDHPVAQAVLASFRGGQGGLAAPSANRFGRISPTTAAHVRSELGEAVSLVLDGGACAVGIESTIVDCSRLHTLDGLPRILRPGGVQAQAIAAALGCTEQSLLAPPHRLQGTRLQPQRADLEPGLAVQATDAAPEAPRVPGALASHYAPVTPLHMVQVAALDTAWPLAQRIGVLAPRAAPGANRHSRWLAMPAEAPAYAQALYAALRELDAAGLEAIWAQVLPADAHWDAVRDRLHRAAAEKA